MKLFVLQIPMWLLVGWMAWYVKSLSWRGRRSPINENILRPPGHSVQQKQLDALMNLLLYIFGVIGAPYFFLSLTTPSSVVNWTLFVAGVAVVVFCFYKCVECFRYAIRMHLAVEAETVVGQELGYLMHDGAWVFHDIPYQYGNIDHVIISSGGVFAIETKGISKPTDRNKSGSENATLAVERGVLKLPHATLRKPIDQANTHARWLRNEIKRRFSVTVPVRAVVAIPGWMINGGFDGDCWVVNPKRGNALRAAVVKPMVSSEKVKMIAAWMEDLARSIPAKSKEFDPKS